MRAVLTSLLEINSEKLRAFHKGHGTLGLQVAVEERKKLCLERGWVQRSCVDCVRDVYSPLPVIVGVANLSDSNSDRPMRPPEVEVARSRDDTEGDDDVSLDIPKTPSYEPFPDPLVVFTPPTSQDAAEYDSDELFVAPKTPSYSAPTEEEQLFITQSTAPKARGHRQKRRSKKAQDRTTPAPKRTRITHFFRPSQE